MNSILPFPKRQLKGDNGGEEEDDIDRMTKVEEAKNEKDSNKER